MAYLMWVPSVILSIGLMAWLSYKADDSWRWFGWLFLSGCIFQFWPWVARYSNKIVFDAILYDAIGILSWTGWLMYFSGTRFTFTQWAGTLVVFIGLLLVQRG